MQRLCICLLILGVWPAAALVVAGDGQPADENAFKVLSFNIRYPAITDGKNYWPLRREMVRDVIRRIGADFVGLQEATPPQLAYLRNELPEYGVLARTREADPAVGEMTPLLYRKSRWKPDAQEQGTFWLSEKPDKPGSRSWNTACPRIVTWARFVDRRTDRALYVYNTHLDHRSAEARRKGARLLAERIAGRLDHEPVLLTGDFNCGESSKPMSRLKGTAEGSPVKLRDTFRVVHPEAKDVGTFHGFSGRRSATKIDYVLASPAFRVLSAEILLDNVEGRYPSDHFPVVATVVLDDASRGGTD